MIYKKKVPPAAFIRREAGRWSKLIAELNLKLD
jgi:hypothetical protein